MACPASIIASSVDGCGMSCLAPDCSTSTRWAGPTSRPATLCRVIFLRLRDRPRPFPLREKSVWISETARSGGRLPDPGAGGGHPDQVRVVAGEALRRPPVRVDELAVLADVGGYGIGPGPVGVDPGRALEDHVRAAPAVALEVQADARVRLDVADLRPAREAVDQELAGLPEEPDRCRLRLA